jgi:hypothetical protein
VTATAKEEFEMTDNDQTAAMESAILAATKAPSIHNTQPWRFHLEPDRIEVYADFSRHLEVLDPTRRQLYISCGAALHHLRVALRAAGLDAFVEFLPEDATDHLATVVVVAGKAPTSQELAVAAAIDQRHTQREPFESRPVDDQFLSELRRAAEAEGAWLDLVRGRDDEITLAVLLSHADEAELETPSYQEELHRWRRTEPATDGIPDSALPSPGAGRHSEVTLRDFRVGDPDHDPGASPSDREPKAFPDERPALVILGTDADTPLQWLSAGQALSHLLLQATDFGMRASMLGQVIDLPGTRSQLRALLRLVGEPQMVLRIGYGPVAPATPRRPLSDVLN